MTLKTVTGPSTRDALAHARRLFGTDVVLLQSAPAAHGQPASVTVAFDTEQSTDPSLSGPLPSEAWTVEPARPEPVHQPAPRAYGYSNVRKPRPADAETMSAPASTPPTPSFLATPTPASPIQEREAAPPLELTTTAPLTSSISVRAGAPPAAASSTPEAYSLAAQEPSTNNSHPKTDREPTASASEVAALRARLAELESAIAEVRASAPPPVLRREPLVFVGPGGSGKTSMVLRLAQSPELTAAQCPAVVIIAPEAERFVDPAPVFWGIGIPVAVVTTPDDMTEAIETFADADLLIIDTPSLPLSADRARPVVRRLGEMLAPLGDVEVHFVLDATRSRSTVTAAALYTLGLTPDALALARLDEAPADAAGWADHLKLPIRFTSSGPDLSDLSNEPLASPVTTPSFAVEPIAPGIRSLTDLFEAASVSPQARFTHVPVLA